MENYNINEKDTYRIIYKDIKDLIWSVPLKECKLKSLEGHIANFCPTAEVVIDTEDGLQIVSYRQIVEMIIIKKFKEEDITND